MDDAALVCRVECIGHLARDWYRLGDWYRAASKARLERLPLDQLEHERTHAVAFFEPVNAGDVRVIE